MMLLIDPFLIPSGNGGLFRQGQGELIVAGDWLADVGLKHGVLAFERRIKGGKLGHGFLGEGEIVGINLDPHGLEADRLGGGHGGACWENPWTLADTEAAFTG